jgi:DNA topoisomerase IA
MLLFNLLCRHELWKPDLRALMESDMKAVSDGRKTKAQVLEAALHGMKECFNDVFFLSLFLHTHNLPWKI